MLNWLKYFGLNFFNAKYARQSAERSLWNSLLSFLLAIIGLFVAFCIMATATFPTHYDKSTDFKKYYHGLFEGENALSLKLEDRKLSWGNATDNDFVINTYTQEEFKSYAKNGYNVIVDLRDGSLLYNDCAVTFKKDKDYITYDEYLELTEADKSAYTATLVMSDKNIEFTEELVDGYVNYVGINGDDDAKAELESYGEDGVIKSENYGKVYALYFKTKYSSLGSGFSTAPTMRNYYINTYLAVNSDGQSVYDNYVILLYDIAFAAWHTDDGQVVTVSGYYGDQASIVDKNSSAESKDEFLIDLFKANKASLKVNYFLYMIKAVFVIGFIWLLLPMVIFILAMIAKVKTLTDYGAMCKTMGGFWLGSFIASLLFIVIGSFFLSQTYVFYLAIVIFVVVDLIRTIVHFVPLVRQEIIQKRKAAKEAQKSANG